MPTYLSPAKFVHWTIRRFIDFHDFLAKRILTRSENQVTPRGDFLLKRTSGLSEN